MSDTLDDTGLTLQTLTEIVDDLTAQMQAIYGSDINVDSDSPDGQMINIFAQAGIDIREVLQSIYSSMDPDQASGVVLDSRTAINGIKRKGATFTITPVNITIDRALSLVGLDDSSESTTIPSGVFTIKDDAGTQWVLFASVTESVPGTYSLSFRSSNIGAVLATIGTITTAVTVVAGVTAISNTSGVTVQGEDEETDTELKIRRAKIIAYDSIGYIDSLRASLLNLDKVTLAEVYENTSAAVDSDGIPAHGIWAIVQGGVAADIASTIYAKRPSGIAMKGSVSHSVTRVNGLLFTVLWDVPSSVNLYIEFTISLYGDTIDTAFLASEIVANITYGLGVDASSDNIVTYLKGLNPKYTITGMLLSLTGSSGWAETIACPTKASIFALDTARIAITTG